MRLSALLFSLLLLAACTPGEVALPLPAAFYPTAVAHSPAEGAFYVAGLAEGEVVRIAPGGEARHVRSGDPALRALVRGGRLWLLTPDAIESPSLEGGRAERHVLPAGFAPVDFAVWSDATVFVLGSDGALLRIALPSGKAGEFARLGDFAREAAGGGGGLEGKVAASATAMERKPSAAVLAAASGALAAFPGAQALLAAHGDALYRIDAQRGTVARVAADTALSGVTQIVRTGDGPRGERVAMFRGHANRVQSATLSRDLRTLTPDLSAGRYDAPFRGAWDGRSLRVLVGRLPHHPGLAGDGRPPLPYRLAQREPATGAPGVDTDVAMTPPAVLR